jgi:hypothetical protein
MNMKKRIALGVASAIAMAAAPAFAGTDIFFNPLTQSTAVATPNHVNELNQPWTAPAGVVQKQLTSMKKIEAAIGQSVVRVPGLGTGASMWDMVAYDPTGKFIFIPHETQFGAGLSRYDIENDTNTVLFRGDNAGASGNWSNDFGAFDPSVWTPNDTVIVAEEWAGQGRMIEVLNPMAAPADIQKRELQSIANVAHEGIKFSSDNKAIYYVDEYNSGSIYKFVMKKAGDYAGKGQTFVLKVDAFAGDPVANYNASANLNQPRTGLATWVPLTDADGNKLTSTDPFANAILGGRPAADEVGGTPYGRPEDLEISKLASRKPVVYFTATSEQAVYSIEELGNGKAEVRLFASEAATPKNLGMPATTGKLNSPDNLAIDALGNIYIIEDAPNGDNIGGDIWFARDTDNDGVAESLDHFLSIQVDGAEATGMIFNPAKPTEFVVSVQHPDSTGIPNGQGDALWVFDLSDVVAPICEKSQRHTFKTNVKTCSHDYDFNFVKMLERTVKHDHKHNR